MSQLIQLSDNSYIYRGCTIHKCQRNAVTPKTAYSISNNGLYLGSDFSMAEAVKTVDKLHADGARK